MNIIQRIGDQIYIEDINDWTGEVYYEWRYSPEPKCACGKRNFCRSIQETTFTEKYECGYTYHYTNHNGYVDNLISVNGKRIK